MTFLRKNWHAIYAFVLIILVPFTILLNTYLIVDRFQETVDAELQRTAVMIGKMFNVTGQDVLTDTVKLQERVNAVARALPEIRSLDVITKSGDEFRLIASLAADDVGKTATGRQNVLAWYDGQPVVYLTKSAGSAAQEQALTPEEARGRDRFWAVVLPLNDASGEKVHLLSIKISLSRTDSVVRDNLLRAYLGLTLTLLIIVLILASNTRLFQYSNLYKRLKEVDRMKDDFITMASHELRAPVTAVRGYLSLFLDEAFVKLEEKPRQIMATTMTIADHLSMLVEDLLDVSRIEQGRMKLNPEALEPEPLIEELMAQLRFEAEKKGLSLSFERPVEPLPRILVDRSRMKQVLINLLSNAIKYTQQGSITVTAETATDGLLEIRVTDTGLGMSAEACENLFQKFHRIRNTDTANITGTGLGLWITKQIVEAMEGRIHCDSIEKVGTRMRVLFPIAKS